MTWNNLHLKGPSCCIIQTRAHIANAHWVCVLVLGSLHRRRSLDPAVKRFSVSLNYDFASLLVLVINRSLNLFLAHLVHVLLPIPFSWHTLRLCGWIPCNTKDATAYKSL